MDDASAVGRWLTRQRGDDADGRDHSALGVAHLRSSFGVAEERFAALEPTGIQESDELYLVSDTNANVKVRDAFDGRQGPRRDERRRTRAVAPDHEGRVSRLGEDDVGRISSTRWAGRRRAARARHTRSINSVAELAPRAGLRPVNVHKRRVRYKVGGCTSEVTDVVADGVPTRTIAIESEDAAAVVAAVKSMGLSDLQSTRVTARA